MPGLTLALRALIQHLLLQSWQTVRPRQGIQGSAAPRQGRLQSSFNPYAGPFFPGGAALCQCAFLAHASGPQQGTKSPSKLLASALDHIAWRLPSTGSGPSAIHQAAGLLEGRQSPPARLTCVKTPFLCSGQQRISRAHICCSERFSQTCYFNRSVPRQGSCCNSWPIS